LFRRLTGFLKENAPSPWFVGDSVTKRVKRVLSAANESFFCVSHVSKMTWADIVAAEFLERVESLHEAGFMSGFPELKAHQERVYKTPGIAKRVATRPDWTM